MSMQLDGKKLSEEIQLKLKDEVSQWVSRGSVRPKLVVILVGDQPASRVYVRNKQKAAEFIGFESILDQRESSILESELLSLIEQYNRDVSVHGILVQLPLPDHIDERKVIEAIAPEKDVDGFHPYNIGRLSLGETVLTPCTPLGIIRLLKAYDIQLAEKNVVIIGRSNIVGKPLVSLLLSEDATVTVTHSKTKNLKMHTQQADVLIVATGYPEWIDASYVKEGAVVVDVGINRTEDGRLVGDVAYESVAPKASAITPVPGGVGPMTIAMLMEQTFIQYQQQQDVISNETN